MALSFPYRFVRHVTYDPCGQPCRTHQNTYTQSRYSSAGTRTHEATRPEEICDSIYTLATYTQEPRSCEFRMYVYLSIKCSARAQEGAFRDPQAIVPVKSWAPIVVVFRCGIILWLSGAFALETFPVERWTVAGISLANHHWFVADTPVHL